MRARVITVFLLVGLVFSGATLIRAARGFQPPGGQKGYEPAQPIAFSHRLHAGELEVPCLYCHYGAVRSRHAGIPAAGVCLNCHRFVTASFGAVREEDRRATKEKRSPRRIVSPEIQKLYDHLAVDAKMLPVPGKTPEPIEWVKVHNLPDFVYFDHRPHAASGLLCQACHGPVETMERVRQEATLAMGWCVNCHRQFNKYGVSGRKVNASIDCSACHF